MSTALAPALLASTAPSTPAPAPTPHLPHPTITYDEILKQYLDPMLTLRDIADECSWTLEQLCTWLDAPEQIAAIERLERVFNHRGRVQAANYNTNSATKLSDVIDVLVDDIHHHFSRYDTAAQRNALRNMAETLRKSVWTLQRLTGGTVKKLAASSAANSITNPANEPAHEPTTAQATQPPTHAPDLIPATLTMLRAHERTHARTRPSRTSDPAQPPEPIHPPTQPTRFTALTISATRKPTPTFSPSIEPPDRLHSTPPAQQPSLSPSLPSPVLSPDQLPISPPPSLPPRAPRAPPRAPPTITPPISLPTIEWPKQHKSSLSMRL